MKRGTNGPSHHSFNGHTHRAPGTEHEPANMLGAGGWEGVRRGSDGGDGEGEKK